MNTTKAKNGNGRTKGATPELKDILTKRGVGRPKKTRTADQIADSIEAEVKRLQGVADILRGS